jgi:MSHA biogenesis protein MshQ
LTVTYKDVGLIAISAKDDTTTNATLPTGIRGSSSNFVVKPSTFSMAIRRTDNSVANPAATTATGAVFIPAGQAFTVVVTSLDSAGATTPNFGIETPAETVQLPATLVLPVGGQNPALAGAFTVSGGVLTGTTFSWGEVGIINVTPRLGDGSYLGAGDVIGPAANVGRFIPYNFGVTQNSPVIAPACTASGYVYIGQPLTYSTVPVLSLTARAFGGTTTQNYQNAFFKLTNTSSSGRNYVTSTGTLDQTGLPANDPAVSQLGNGLAALTFNSSSGIFYVRTTPVAPFTPTLTLSLNILDTDGVAASTNVNLLSTNPWVLNTPSISAPELRYGRVAFRNAVGSELLNLPVSMRAEYFLNATTGFVQHSSDSCTTGVTMALASYGGNLNSGETCLINDGTPGVGGVWCAAGGLAAQQFKIPPVAGDFAATLRAPGANNDGTVTVTTVVPSWLRFDWNAAVVGLENPSGVATFGIFKGDAKRIFQTEK